jgi:membrane fusion protein (multidrug efflux system)
MAEEDQPDAPAKDDKAEDAKQADQDKKDKAEDDKAKQKQEQEDERKRARTKPFVRLGLVAIILLFIAGGFALWWTTKGKQTTDDAYTAGRVVNIAPQVSGYIVELDVNDNQFVHQGQILARIDPRNYQAVLDSDTAQVSQAQGQLEGSRYSVEVARKNFPAQLAQAKGQLLQSQGQEFQAETDYRRQHAVARAATTQQAIDQSTAALQEAQGQVAIAQAQVQSATPVGANIGVQQTRISQQAGALGVAQASLEQAKLNLGWTVIRAPHDGWIAQRNVEQGNYVNVGQNLFAIVQPEIWITANFKETQLAHMLAGQLVDITVDAYPQLHLKGHVDSIQLGSGGQFSAFPPENATGNFVKIVQRVPVKILIDGGLDPNLPLPIGLSVEPTVYIGTRPAAP